MINLFNSGISIEKMAAFIDGNLPADEMRDISAVIDEDSNLQKFIETNYIVDDAIPAILASEIELPSEIQTPDFELPSLDDLNHNTVPISPNEAASREGVQKEQTHRKVAIAARRSYDNDRQNTTQVGGFPWESVIGNVAAAAIAPTSKLSSTSPASFFDSILGDSAGIAGSASKKRKKDK